MRPVNLIPLEERRGEQRPLRSGPLAYILLGALVAVLAGVTALVLVGNQIEEREAQITELTREDEAAAAKAARLSPFVEFRNLAEQRVETVSSLADSRFDWERVMRELALILPEDAWLTGLTASASADSGVSGGGSGGLRGTIAGPALELSGCAAGQESVAGFVTTLKDIEGVTRVAVQSSELPEKGKSGEGDGGGSGGGEECRTRDFIAKFQIVVAFDAAPVPVIATEGAESAVVAEDPPGESEESSEDEGESEGE
jgi:Tfp pilus assembly protein PilN